MAFGGGGDRRFMSEINVTPLVDVMLVLLIIFMVTAPMMQEGMSVNVPKVKATALDTGEEEPVVLIINNTGQMRIKKTKISMNKLEEELKLVFNQRVDKTLYLRADETVNYGQVVQAMAIAKEAGAEKLSMITQPPDEN